MKGVEDEKEPGVDGQSDGPLVVGEDSDLQHSNQAGVEKAAEVSRGLKDSRESCQGPEPTNKTCSLKQEGVKVVEAGRE